MEEVVSKTTFNIIRAPCSAAPAARQNPLEFGTTSVKSAGFQPAGEASSTTPPKDAGLQTRTSRNLSLSQAAMACVTQLIPPVPSFFTL